MADKKIDFRKHYVLVLDIETANTLEQGLAYDIGFAVADRKGNIYETRSLMIAEMFYNAPSQAARRRPDPAPSP